MNTFTATGRLMNDGQLANTANSSVVNFRVATDAGYGKHQKTLRLDCSLWGSKGNSLQQHLTKGKWILIAGELSTKDYKRKDGTAGTALTLNVDRLEFINTRRSDTDQSRRQAPTTPQNPEPTPPPAYPSEEDAGEPSHLEDDSIWNR